MKVMFAKVDTDIKMTEEVSLNSIDYMKALFELLEVTPNRFACCPHTVVALSLHLYVHQVQ